jgi:hypothetical protein
MSHAQIVLTGKRLTTPRAAALAGILFAGMMTTRVVWMVLVFPGWVFLISVYILIINLRRHTTGTMDGMTVDNRL